MQCVILAGGLGTRMSRLTASMPKAMIPVAGEPFVRHQLRRLAEDGVTDVVISVGHMGEMIEDEVARHRPPGMTVVCVNDGPTLLGTGGAIRLAIDRGLVGPQFLVEYGDSYLTVDHGDVWRSFDDGSWDALMSVLRNDAGLDVSNARVADGAVVEYTKGVADPAGRGMMHVDYGLSVMRTQSVVEHVPAGAHCDLATVMHTVAAQSRLQAYEVSERFYEIGSERGLAALEAHLGHGVR
jgi:NDP-sugar pyrophosphorylase family protein